MFLLLRCIRMCSINGVQGVVVMVMVVVEVDKSPATTIKVGFELFFLAGCTISQI